MEVIIRECSKLKVLLVEVNLSGLTGQSEKIPSWMNCLAILVDGKGC